MNCYQLSPHVFIERFDEEAVMLVADRDVMVTVNYAAAQIFEQARETVDYGTFSRSDCVNHLLQFYDLTRNEAEAQTRSLLGFALKHRMVLKRCTV